MMTNKEKIKLIVDSGSDVDPSVLEKYDIDVLPLHVIFKDGEYRDGFEITADEVYARLEEEIPTTSLPSGEDITEVFERVEAEGYEKVIVLTISSGLSGTNNIVNIIANDFKGLEVEVIDSLNVSVGSGVLMNYITRELDAGASFEEVVSATRKKVKDSTLFFSIPTLKYLEAGGRIGRVASLLGGILNINPVISCDDDGIYYVAARSRGRKKSIKKMQELVQEIANKSSHYELLVGYSDQGSRAEAEALKEKFEEILPQSNNLKITRISPALGVHAGPGLIGCVILTLD